MRSLTERLFTGDRPPAFSLTLFQQCIHCQLRLLPQLLRNTREQEETQRHAKCQVYLPPSRRISYFSADAVVDSFEDCSSLALLSSVLCFTLETVSCASHSLGGKTTTCYPAAIASQYTIIVCSSYLIFFSSDFFTLIHLIFHSS